jgi:hypothetical protein
MEKTGEKQNQGCKKKKSSCSYGLNLGNLKISIVFYVPTNMSYHIAKKKKKKKAHGTNRV